MTALPPLPSDAEPRGPVPGQPLPATPPASDPARYGVGSAPPVVGMVDRVAPAPDLNGVVQPTGSAAPTSGSATASTTMVGPYPHGGPVTYGEAPVAAGTVLLERVTQPLVVAESAAPGGQLPPPDRPAPGELGIRERRSWRTWQLLLTAVVAAVFGMWFNGNSGASSGASGGSGGARSYSLPPNGAAAGSSTTATTSAAGATTATTTAAGATTATTTAAGAAGATTSTTAPTGPATVLIPATELHGNWTSSAFTIAGGQWNIGWAYRCTPAPASGPAFEIFVVPAGGTPGQTPVVTEATATGQAITPETTAGSQQVVVETEPNCEWVVKVVGIS